MRKLITFAWKEDNEWVSWCPNPDVASWGKTKDHAFSNLQEALELYFEESDEDKKNVTNENLNTIDSRELMLS